MDDGALGDGDVDAGCGGGGRWGEGGSDCGGWGVLVSVRVWVRAGSLGLPSLLLWSWWLRGVVLVVVRLRVVLSFGFRFGFGVGFWVRVRFKVEEDLGARWGGFLVCCWGAWVACVGVGGPLVAWRAAAAFALAVPLWMRPAGRGGSEDEVEEVGEDEDEEEVVVLVETGCAVMRAVAGFWLGASAAATAGKMEGMSSSRRFGVGGLGARALTWRPSGPIWSAAVGDGGPGLRSSPSGLGLAGLRCMMLCGFASAGGNSSRRLHSGPGGGGAWVPRVVCGARVRATRRVGRAVGRGAPCVGCVRVAGVGSGGGCSAHGSLAGVCGCLGMPW